MLTHYINNDTNPFGHGFVVAAELAGIPPEAYGAQRPAFEMPADKQ